LALDYLLAVLVAAVLTAGQQAEAGKARSKVQELESSPDRAADAEAAVAAGRKKVAQLELEHKKASQGLAFTLFLIYVAVALGWQGRTLGKAALRLRVVPADGGPLGWKQAIIRTILYPLSASLFCLGFIWAFFDTNRQTWHDKIAGTHVIVAGGE
jgi:hypothetical protein